MLFFVRNQTRCIYLCDPTLLSRCCSLAFHREVLMVRRASPCFLAVPSTFPCRFAAELPNSVVGIHPLLLSSSMMWDVLPS